MKTIGIIGKKMKMTQIIVGEELVGVTPIGVGGNVVSQIKSKEKEGYDACQIAFENCAERKLARPLSQHLKKANLTPKKYLREIRDMVGFEVGSPVEPNLFHKKDIVKISSISKGKGTAGVIKRYGFSRGRMSHGGGYPHRLIGSMGGGRGTNQGIPKGKKMPGRMGNEKVTQQSVIEKIDSESQIIYVKGGVPGPKKNLVILKTSSLFSASKYDLITGLINLLESKIKIFLPESNFEPSKMEGLDWELKNFAAWELKDKLKENNYQLIKKVLPSYWKRQEGGLEGMLERENLTLEITRIFTRRDKYGKVVVIRDEDELSLLFKPFNFEFSLSQKVNGETKVSKFESNNNPIDIKIRQ